MCGGAIISDFIPTSRSRLWSGLQKNPGNYYSKPLRSEIVDIDDDFEADFQDFKGESDGEEEDFKIFSFAPKSTFSRGMKCGLFLSPCQFRASIAVSGTLAIDFF